MDSDLVFDLPNDVGAIEQAVERVVRKCEGFCTDERKIRLNFRVGLMEALSNAMLNGNDCDPSKRVRVEVFVSAGSLTARITDEGNGFDPRRLPDPTAPHNILKPNGRGIFLMRKLVDEVHFNERGNSVTLVVRLRDDTLMEGGAHA